ncbi:unnamed protein product [Ilex paraguariensis]|uniref:Uncharacterized protein n=1 Tax=Ilex paraguariensis TaxID=185542 RepID=A0ABC8T3W1_9AQUA
MKCIHGHSPFFPTLSLLKHNHQLKMDRLLWLSSNHPTTLLQRKYIISPVPSSTKATMASLPVLGATSPATSGDISVFLQTSAVLLFMYWITNFVVPEIIYKDLQNKTSEEKSPMDNFQSEAEQGSTPIDNEPSSGQIKRGFNSTKPK